MLDLGLLETAGRPGDGDDIEPGGVIGELMMFEVVRRQRGEFPPFTLVDRLPGLAMFGADTGFDFDEDDRVPAELRIGRWIARDEIDLADRADVGVREDTVASRPQESSGPAFPTPAQGLT